mmetsp:Transcript_12710/g.14519  ORF Transcript_12710/g.14519 Transcript_12710/m.14519 type:complete len:102 (+) Transcript_12710:119-424(+)
MKPLKALFNEALCQTMDAQENLTAYSKQVEESEYSLKAVKILKEDTASNALYSILAKVKSHLQSQCQRIKDSFMFIERHIEEGKREKQAISNIQKNTKQLL